MATQTVTHHNKPALHPVGCKACGGECDSVCVCVTVCVSVSRAQRVVFCCDLMRVDVCAVSRSSNVHYPRSDKQQHQGETQELKCFQSVFKGRGQDLL